MRLCATSRNVFRSCSGGKHPGSRSTRVAKSSSVIAANPVNFACQKFVLGLRLSSAVSAASGNDFLGNEGCCIEFFANRTWRQIVLCTTASRNAAVACTSDETGGTQCRRVTLTAGLTDLSLNCPNADGGSHQSRGIVTSTP